MTRSPARKECRTRDEGEGEKGRDEVRKEMERLSKTKKRIVGRKDIVRSVAVGTGGGMKRGAKPAGLVAPGAWPSFRCRKTCAPQLGVPLIGQEFGFREQEQFGC